MESSKLTSIERDLVLQYLIDGNVPVILTPVEKIEKDIIQSVPSKIFPIAIKGEYLKVEKSGKIILDNPSASIREFLQKTVKVEFYFNKLGLFFLSVVKEDNQGFYIEFPQCVERIQDVMENSEYDISAILYFEMKTKKELNLQCVPWENIELFMRPVWKSIPLENQKEAKALLEEFVEMAKVEKNLGNGIQLIPICNYFTQTALPIVNTIQDRRNPINIIYLDHERIVLALEYTAYTFTMDDEYGVKLQFSLKKGPILSRDIYVTTKVNKIYKSKDERYFCIDMKLISVQEEDLRFLFEKATKQLFI